VWSVKVERLRQVKEFYSIKIEIYEYIGGSAWE
jgi:hypothetical protein